MSFLSIRLAKTPELDDALSWCSCGKTSVVDKSVNGAPLF